MVIRGSSSRRFLQQGKLFVLGDSFSTIRRTGGTNDRNGRFSAITGWNLWDWFRFGFEPPLEMDITTNFAREGAYATRNWSPAPAWSAINPIPSLDSQITQLIAANPIGVITPFDVCGILIGTNDGINPDGGTKPTDAQVETAILAGINRLIGHGFRSFMIWFPESKHLPTLRTLLQPGIDTLQNNNRSIVFATGSIDSGTLELSVPYLDGTHPKDSVHERLGEIAVSQFFNQNWIDRTQSFFLTLNGSTSASPREIGFNNFNPNVHGARFVLADQFNCFEAITNRRLTLRSFNGLVINGAFEANSAVSGVGGGKNDPCLIVQGNFWEHAAVIQLVNVANVPVAQSPFIRCLGGATELFRLGSDGIIKVGQWNATPVPVLFGGTGATTQTQAISNLGIGQPSFHAHQIGVGGSFSHGVRSTVIYNTKVSDPNVIYNATNGTVTIPSGRGGTYLINGGVYINGACSTISFGVFRSGTEIGRLFSSQTPTDVSSGGSGSVIVPLAAGDVISASLYQENTSSVARTLLEYYGLSFFKMVRLF